MRRVLLMTICLFLSATFIAQAQSRKAGLWEMTTNMEFKQSPFPQGMPGGNTHTVQVCVTQEQLDKYNAIVPGQGPQNNCQVTNLVKTANGMSAEMVCTGRMNGKGSMQSSWSDSEHASGSTHFVGSMQMGQQTVPIEWITHTTSVFKGSDCGNVKPLMPPATK